jgi:carboxylesterase type B
LPINAQNIYLMANQAGNTQSEDCLSLNVWTKGRASGAKKAVLVWLYGGCAFHLPSSCEQQKMSGKERG